MSFRLCVRASALAVAVLALGASSAAASFPGYNGRLAYTPDNPFAVANAVYTMGANGSGVAVLSNARGGPGDFAPAWSADGTQVAFSRSGAIWVMSADGSGARRVTDGSGDSDPTWSPDAARIAFVRDRDIWTVDLAGGAATNLTADGPASDPEDGPEVDAAPDWSPDGKKIAFETNRSGRQIYTMNPDGSGPAAVSDSLAGTQPSWSPDGRRIAFVNGGIAAVNADGTDPVTIK